MQITRRVFWLSGHFRPSDLGRSPRYGASIQVLVFRSRAMSAMTRDPGGFQFRRFLAIMAILAISGGPHPLFSRSCCKQSTSAIRPLGGACVALAWPLGGPRVAQGWPKRHPNPIPTGSHSRAAFAREWAESQSGRGSQSIHQVPSTKYQVPSTKYQTPNTSLLL